MRGGIVLSQIYSGEQEVVILDAGRLPSQPAHMESVQVERAGTQPVRARGKRESRLAGPGSLAVGWFGDRKRIPFGTGIQVTRFQVWQDLSGSGDCTTVPLHAAVTLEMSNEWYSSLTTPEGTIRIEIIGTLEVIEAKLLLHNANHDLGPTHLGSNRSLQFVVSPTPLHRKLNPDETARGIAKLKFGNRKVKIKLLETEVQFTR